MDYVVNIDGIDLVIEQHTIESRQQSNHQQRNRLLAYYEKLLKVSGTEETPERLEALNQLVDNMTEKSAESKADNLEKAQLNRVLAYAEKIFEFNLKQQSSEDTEKISKAEVEKTDKMAEALVEVLDATIEDDTNNQETVDINGNKFIYDKKSLNIRDYVKKLFDIGEKTKGNTWTIYLDEEGELVIY